MWVARGGGPEGTSLLSDADALRPCVIDRRNEMKRFVMIALATAMLARQLVRRGLIGPADSAAEVYDALVLGTRDYVLKNGFSKVVIGLSGGIDSSLVAAVSVDALGAAAVTGVAMPSRYSTPGSLADAERLAENLSIKMLNLPFDGIFQAYLELLAPVFKGKAPDIGAFER